MKIIFFFNFCFNITITQSRNIIYKSTYLIFGAKKKDEFENNDNMTHKVHSNPKNWPGLKKI